MRKPDCARKDVTFSRIVKNHVFERDKKKRDCDKVLFLTISEKKKTGVSFL